MVDGGKPGVDSRDEGKHIRREDDVDGRARPKMKSECCEEAEL